VPTERATARAAKHVWPLCPVLYEINTWVWLHELSQKYGRNIILSASTRVGCRRGLSLERGLAHGCLGTESQRRRDRQSESSLPKRWTIGDDSSG